jgi:hypothetical protein
MTEDDEPEIELSGEREGAPLDVTRVPVILSLNQVRPILTCQVSTTVHLLWLLLLLLLLLHSLAPRRKTCPERGREGRQCFCMRPPL